MTHSLPVSDRSEAEWSQLFELGQSGSRLTFLTKEHPTPGPKTPPRSPSSALSPFFLGGSPTKIDYRTKGYPYSNLSTGGPSKPLLFLRRATSQFSLSHRIAEVSDWWGSDGNWWDDWWDDGSWWAGPAGRLAGVGVKTTRTNFLTLTQL